MTQAPETVDIDCHRQSTQSRRPRSAHPPRLHHADPRRDLWAFDRFDRWALLGLLGLVSILKSVATFAILIDLDLDDLGARAAFAIPLLPVLVGLFVALFAEAFKAGSRLRSDVDGLV